MDGYISKPVNFAEIRETLERVSEEAGSKPESPTTGTEPVSSAEAAPVEEPKLWDPEAALARVDFDRELFGEVVEIFCEEGPKLLRKLEEALAASDCEAGQRAAHSIKGEVSYFACASAVATAKEMENLAREQNLDLCRAKLPELQKNLQQLTASVAAWRQQVKT